MTALSLQILTYYVFVACYKRFRNLELEPETTMIKLKIRRHEQQLLRIEIAAGGTPSGNTN